jgi:hypothetical protein
MQYGLLIPHFNSPIKILARFLTLYIKKTISIESFKSKNWIRAELSHMHAKTSFEL